MRLFWLAMLTAHGTAAVAWWWLLPGGFGVCEARFWVNEVLPLCVLALVVTLRFGIRNRETLRDGLLAVFPAFWIAVGVSARLVFPESARWFWLAPLGLGVALLAATLAAKPPRAAWVGVAIVIATVLGAVMPVAERGADPDTRPLATTSSSPPPDFPAPSETRAITLAPDVKLDPGDPVVTLLNGRVTLAVQPVLTFVSRSPDRCWTLFASKPQRDGPTRRLTGLARDGETVRLLHRADVESVTDFRPSPAGGIDIDSQTFLPAPIYSHLNTFAELTVSGHRKLAVAFSPCPDARIEFRPFTVRGDLPGRAAYLAADGSFKVVQARRAEKGPFTTLAQGRLRRGEPLTLTLYDQDRPIFELTLADWSSQAGVQPSPTAGYGLPVNALEFSLDGDSDRSAGGVWITLAATSVGRGWDSVGHAAGTYRNRLHVRALP
jgi:hypothetical protein